MAVTSLYTLYNHKQTHSAVHIAFPYFLMSCLMLTSPYEVGLPGLIGCGFQFGVNRFEKEYLRKCAFWQRLQAGMYVAHVSLEIDVESLGSPLECTPLLSPPTATVPTPLHDSQYQGRPHRPHAKENIHVTQLLAQSWRQTLALLLIHMHTNNKNKEGGLVNE